MANCQNITTLIIFKKGVVRFSDVWYTIFIARETELNKIRGDLHMEKRIVKEATATRERFYADLVATVGESFSDHKFIGRATEGLVFENADGLSVVVKVITKAIDFDGGELVQEFEDKEAEKKAKESKKNGKVKIVKKAD